MPSIAYVDALDKCGLLDGGQLVEATMMVRAGRFDEASVLFEEISKKVVGIAEYYSKSLSGSLDNENLEKEKIALLFDILDSLCYIQKEAAKCAYEAVEAAIAKSKPVPSITAVESLVKVV